MKDLLCHGCGAELDAGDCDGALSASGARSHAVVEMRTHEDLYSGRPTMPIPTPAQCGPVYPKALFKEKRE